MNKRTHVLLVGSLVIVFGIAIGQDQEGDANEAGSDSDAASAPACFSIRQAQSIDALHDGYVYLEGAGSQHFVLTMTAICPGLRGSRGIAIQNRGQDRVCSGDLAQVVYRPFGNAPPINCSIGEVTAVEDQEAAEALVESLTQ